MRPLTWLKSYSHFKSSLHSAHLPFLFVTKQHQCMAPLVVYQELLSLGIVTEGPGIVF